jgi:hypothetical protein
MKSLLLTYTSKEPFESALIRLSQQKQWKVCTLTSFDYEEGDHLLHKEERYFRYSAFTLLMAFFGIAAGFGMQWYSAVENVPLNIGGRPLNSWPAFFPPTFIIMILCGAVGVFLFFFFHMRLPWPSHPIFSTQTYDLSKQQYQIMLEESSTVQEMDPHSLSADSIEEVPCPS